ncbi:MAG: zinc ABC transporter substrate-binding protein [Nitratireductor sp.]|nr:zinc ABC transporter substrate-binding protein [Nitratireductor sp.]
MRARLLPSFTAFLLMLVAPAAMAEVKVVASIKPVHSLVAAVMAGAGEPDLIVEGASSPHDFALKPSQARLLEQADLVFWVGHELEAFLEKPLETIAARARSVELIDAEGLHLRQFEEPVEVAGEAEHAEEEEGDHHHHHEGTDGHIWLDAQNARAMVAAIADALAQADPGNAALYRSNAAATAGRLDALDREITDRLAPLGDRPYVTFHDAYGYFERRYGLAAGASITLSPEVMPGAERITAIRARLRADDTPCVFSEPQFEPKLIRTVTEDTHARTATLDPLGASLADGPDLYFDLMNDIADTMVDCLSSARG